MLSHIGYMTVTQKTARKVYYGDELTSQEEEQIKRLPERALALLEDIPRIDDVKAIIKYHDKRFDGGGIPHDGLAGDAIPIGARVLKVALDYDRYESRLRESAAAIRQALRTTGANAG